MTLLGNKLFFKPLLNRLPTLDSNLTLNAGKTARFSYRRHMPIYVYESIKPDGSTGERFEIHQSMKDDALTTHPETGEPVRRVFLPPNLTTRYTPGQTKGRLENKKLESAGFTKYEKDKVSGKYHRVAGKAGPDVINRPGTP
jgi:predicted nucleic acid-binding Zn ribbon protein